jgi:hypothetical protein
MTKRKLWKLAALVFALDICWASSLYLIDKGYLALSSQTAYILNKPWNPLHWPMHRWVSDALTESLPIYAVEIYFLACLAQTALLIGTACLFLWLKTRYEVRSGNPY